MQDCIFCKIVRGQIPAKKVYEDDEVLGFHDIHPQAPVHFMLIPKRHIASLADATKDDAGVLGRMLTLAGGIARDQGSPDRLVPCRRAIATVHRRPVPVQFEPRWRPVGTHCNARLAASSAAPGSAVCGSGRVRRARCHRSQSNCG